MELVKRKFLNIGSTYGVNVCLSAEDIDEPESSMYLYNNRPIKRIYAICTRKTRRTRND